MIKYFITNRVSDSFIGMNDNKSTEKRKERVVGQTIGPWTVGV